MHIVYNNGTVLDARIVIADDRRLVKGMISAETVPSFGPAADGTTCPPHCGLGVQVSLDGRKECGGGSDHVTACGQVGAPGAFSTQVSTQIALFFTRLACTKALRQFARLCIDTVFRFSPSEKQAGRLRRDVAWVDRLN